MERTEESFEMIRLNRLTDYLRGSVRLACFINLLISYILITIPFLVWFQFSPNTARSKIKYIIRFYSVILAKIMGMNITGEYKPDTSSSLMVANHMSYLDIIAILSIFPVSFITSNEVKNTIFLGTICKLGGCIFIERRSRIFLAEEVKEIANAIKEGEHVFLFPEGTSTNGEEVLRFRQPFFESAILAEVPVNVFAIQYHKVNGIQINQSNRDLLCWYGEMTFFSHFWRFLCSKNCEIEIKHAGKIIPEREMDVTALSTEARKLVVNNCKPF